MVLAVQGQICGASRLADGQPVGLYWLVLGAVQVGVVGRHAAACRHHLGRLSASPLRVQGSKKDLRCMAAKSISLVPTKEAALLAEQLAGASSSAMIAHAVLFSVHLL